jgi:hypothetical protein
MAKARKRKAGEGREATWGARESRRGEGNWGIDLSDDAPEDGAAPPEESLRGKRRPPKPARPPLHRPTLEAVLALVRAEREALERSAEVAGREGGVLLAHAASEWARATECASLLLKLHQLFAETDR